MKNYTITVNGTPYNVTVEENNTDAPVIPVATPVSTPVATPTSAPATPQNAGGVNVDAPMPGNVLEIKVSVGTKVSKGDVLVVLEAMKMENDIVAPQDGTVATINANKGDSVEAGKTLITLN